MGAVMGKSAAQKHILQEQVRPHVTAAMCNAALQGDIPAMRRLVNGETEWQFPADARAVHPEMGSVFSLALSSGNLDAVKFLIEECRIHPSEMDPSKGWPHFISILNAWSLPLMAYITPKMTKDQLLFAKKWWFPDNIIKPKIRHYASLFEHFKSGGDHIVYARRKLPLKHKREEDVGMFQLLKTIDYLSEKDLSRYCRLLDTLNRFEEITVGYSRNRKGSDNSTVDRRGSENLGVPANNSSPSPMPSPHGYSTISRSESISRILDDAMSHEISIIIAQHQQNSRENSAFE